LNPRRRRHLNLEQTFLFFLTRLVAGTILAATAFAFLALAVGRTSILASSVVALSSYQGTTWDIGLMDIEHLLLHLLTHGPADDLSPAWSSARQKLAFYADNGPKGGAEIFLINADGSDVQQLTPEQQNYSAPKWSANGQQLIYVRDHGSIEIMDVDGTNAHGLTDGFAPVWSPTDARIAFSAAHAGDNPDIYLIDTDGRKFYNLTRDAGYDWDPAWSPDGRQLAFVSSRDGSSELFIMDAVCPSACGTNVRRLTFNHANARTPSWSLDGQHILFESEMDGSPQIYIIGADGSDMRYLTDGRSPVWINEIPGG
jgi:Tol biopolymer transport system component